MDPEMTKRVSVIHVLSPVNLDGRAESSAMGSKTFADQREAGSATTPSHRRPWRLLVQPLLLPPYIPALPFCSLCS